MKEVFPVIISVFMFISRYAAAPNNPSADVALSKILGAGATIVAGEFLI